MKAHARGMLRHGFFGEYVGTIGLVFDSADEATAALPKLGAGWTQGKSGKGLVWSGSSTELAAVKAKLASDGFVLTVNCGLDFCKGKCHDAGIDSLAHSVDYGPPFELEIDGLVDPRQTSLAI
jgi:hypothetical protein